MDLISIIVPVYNVEKYIHQCVDSVINQTYKNIEIILVDDGSPDNCGRICDEYAAKDSRIKVIHKANGGLSDARNHGIEAAKGDWLMFIDSDDWIEPDMAQKLLGAAKKEDADMAVCGVILFDETKEYTPDYFCLSQGVFSPKDIFRKNIPTAFVIACNKLFNKSLFSTYCFECGRIHEDEIAAHHLIGKCNRIIAIEDKLYHYRQVSGSITKTVTHKHIDVLYALYDRFEYYKSINYKESSDTVLNSYFWNLDNYYFRVEKNSESAPRLRECMKNTRKLIPYYLRVKDISIKERLLKLVFCISPSLYKQITGIG